GKIAIASSPIVLTMRPPCSSQICRITSSARPIVASASASPSVSYNLVLPAMSANRIAACRCAWAWVIRGVGVAAAEYRGSGRTRGSPGAARAGRGQCELSPSAPRTPGFAARARRSILAGARACARPARTETAMERLGRYQIREIIGEGAMARVYKGYDPEIDREIAIKLLKSQLADDDQYRMRFLREA